MKSKKTYCKTHILHHCERNVRFNKYYYSYYCAHCDVWENYGANNTLHNNKNWPRPEKPSMVTDV